MLSNYFVWLEVLCLIDHVWLPKSVCVVPMIQCTSRCSIHMFCLCMSEVISSLILRVSAMDHRCLLSLYCFFV